MKNDGTACQHTVTKSGFKHDGDGPHGARGKNRDKKRRRPGDPKKPPAGGRGGGRQVKTRLTRDLWNNRRVYSHTRGRFEEMGPCIKVSERHNSGYGASYVCGTAIGAALQNKNLAGTAEAKRARCVVSGALKRLRRTVSGETLRRILNGSRVDDTNRAFICLTRSMLEDLWITGALDPDMPMDIAIDKHYEIRYDRSPDEHLVRGVTDAKKPVSKETYIAAQCIVAGYRFILACLPFGQFDDNASKVRELIGICRGYGIRLGTVMLDREFHSTEVITVLNEEGVTYLIPCVNRGNVPEAVHEFVEGRRGRVSEEVITKDRHTSCRYTMIITERTKLRKKKKDRTPEEKLIAFATNDPDIDVDAYAKRWGIETCFRQIRSTRIKTRCQNYAARHLVFMLSMALYNCWVFSCTMLAWMDSRTVPAKPVMALCPLVGALLDMYEGGPAEPPPEPDPDWPLP